MKNIRDIDINSIDETLLITGGHKISVWGLENHTLIRKIYPGGMTGCIDMDWSDELQLFAWAHDGISEGDPNLWWSRLVVFNLEGVPVDGFSPYGNLPDYPSRISKMKWSSNLPYLGVAFDDGTVRVYDISNQSVLIHQDFNPPIKLMSWNPTGTLLTIAIGGSEKDNVYFIDILNNETWHYCTLRDLSDIDWSPDGKCMFTSYWRGIHGTNVFAWEMMYFWGSGGDWFIASCPTDTILAICGYYGVCFWNYNSSTSENHSSLRKQLSMSGWTKDGSYFYSIDANNVIRIWTRKSNFKKPTVGIETPVKGSEVYGKIDITGWARSTNEETLSVLVKIGLGDWTVANGSSNWSYQFDTETVQDGLLKIRVKAHDINDFSDIIITNVLVKNEQTQVNNPPSIWIIEPKEGAEVWGILPIYGEASDDHRVVAIHIKIGFERWKPIPNVKSDQFVEWLYNADIFYQKIGRMEISIRAYDGNLFSKTVTTTVQVTPPASTTEELSIEIIFPERATYLPPQFTVSGIVTEGVAEEVFIGLDKYIIHRAIGTSIWHYNFSKLSPGSHVVKAIAKNGTMVSPWYSVPFFVDNEITDKNFQPSVGIGHPSTGAFITEDFLLKGWSIDDQDVVQVEVRINTSEWIIVNGTEQWEYLVSTSNFSRGWIDIHVRAFDGELYSPINSTEIFFFESYEPEPETKTPALNYLILISVLLIIIISLIGLLLRRKVIGKSD
jgi:WD40 repeat protein